MRNLPGHIAATVRDHGHVAFLLDSGTESEPGSAEWQLQDASLTRQALESWGKVDTLVVDHYQLGRGWEEDFQDLPMLMGMGGAEPRARQLDVLHDQTYRGANQQVWSGLVHANCDLLLGPKFALLRDEFSAIRRSPSIISDRIRSVVVTLGGSAPDDLTRQVAGIVRELVPRQAEVHVVLSPESVMQEVTFSAATANSATLRFHYGVHRMAALLGRADIAVTGGGVTALEALCLGRPLLVVPWVKNQRVATEHLIADGYCHAGGDGAAFDAGAFGRALLRLVESPQERSRMSDRGRRLLDGRGATRTIKHLGRRMTRRPSRTSIHL